MSQKDLRESELSTRVVCVCVCVCVCVYVRENQDEIISPTQWNTIGRNMTAPLTVLSPRSILPPHSCHCALIPAKSKLVVFFERVIIAVCLNSFEELRKPEFGGM